MFGGAIPRAGWAVPWLLLSLCACRSRSEPKPREPAPTQEVSQEGQTEGKVERETETDPGDPDLPGVARVDRSLEVALRHEISLRGPDYRPRTHHLRADGSPKYVNRLIREASPYLLQHAHNPVNFLPWGPEALALARQLDRPILLSIGYSTCHWCHVMERESFEDEEIAAYLNQHFVSIKVDREERPDLDDLYMAAVTMLTGRGGWPMTVVLTPALEPFFGGTYFPARDGDRGSRKGFLTILRELQHRYATDRKAVVASAGRISERMRRAAQPARPGAVPGRDAIVRTVGLLEASFDARAGGFGRAPKFPQPARLSLLLRNFKGARHEQSLKMVVRTLRAMAAGGMHDQVGGGFHRYSTDARWLVPHFEKMLYDNAQLAVVYLEGFLATGDVEMRRVVERTLDYVLREMTHPQGPFYSAADADSEAADGEQEEGYHFTWKEPEIEAALGADGLAFVRQVYGTSEAGNFEGRNILFMTRPPEALAKAFGLSHAAFWERLDGYRQSLYAARAERPAPGRDDKVLCAWNGLMISALARAGFYLDRTTYIDAARRAADFLWDRMRDPRGRLLRSYVGGRAQHNAYLDDYAFLIAALLDLFEATAEPRYLTSAASLQRLQDQHYVDAEHGGYYTTSDDHERLLVREKPNYDGALPSGNSVAAMNLLRLAELTVDMTYRARAEQVFGAFSRELTQAGLSVPSMLSALDRYLDEPLQVLIVHPKGVLAEALIAAVRRVYLPNAATLVVSEEQLSALSAHVPWLAHKKAIGGRPTAYVCERGACELPTPNPSVLRKQLTSMRR